MTSKCTGAARTPIELVIFDCVDTERIAVRVHFALGAELGWPLTEARPTLKKSHPESG